jgi:hypothetical protein
LRVGRLATWDNADFKAKFSSTAAATILRISDKASQALETLSSRSALLKYALIPGFLGAVPSFDAFSFFCCGSLVFDELV